MKTTPRYIIVLLASLLILATAGCSKKQEAPMPKPEFGILNMAKAIKAHPRYPEVQALQQQLSGLQAQAVQEQDALVAASRKAQLDITNLTKATEQEFQTKMAGKHADLTRRLQAQAEVLRQQMNEQVDKYVRELDESYQDRNFALQVKLKTIELSKEEQAAVQKQMDEIQNERMEKIVAYQQQLTNKMTEQMQKSEHAAAQELDEFGKNLKQRLDSELAVKSQNMQVLPGSGLNTPASLKNLDAQLELANRQLATLQKEIVADIKTSAAKVAEAQGLTTVLADVEIFTDLARDITTDVIDGSK